MKSTVQTCSLEQAVVNGDIDALKKFLKSGENINVMDINGEPPLFIPIVNGDMDTLKFCLVHSDVNMTSEDDKTALMIAVEMNDMDMVKKLIKAGISLRQTEKKNFKTILKFLSFHEKETMNFSLLFCFQI